MMPMSGLNPARILVRGVNWLGDAVMTTPALLRLRERFPQSHITMMAAEKLGDLWTQHPALDGTLIVTPGENLWLIARRLKQEMFDLALILPNSPRSALEPWLARVPVRLGYGRGWRGMLLTQAIPARPDHVRMRKRSVAEIHALLSSNTPPAVVPPSAHQLHDYLGLVAALGASSQVIAPQLHVTDDEVAKARREILPPVIAGGIQRPLFLGLNPGAEYGPAKRWPVENFMAVARRVAREFPEVIWLVCGGKADAKACARVADPLGNRAINLAGATSLRQLMCLLKLCKLVLTNDTGPMHLAAALGTPVIVPFGSTSPELTGPGLPGDPRHHLLRSPTPCAPCFLRSCPIDFRCMTGITVEQVVGAVSQVAKA
jgi:heptosyltransferase II